MSSRPAPSSRFLPRSRALRVWPAWAPLPALPSYKKSFVSSAALADAHGYLAAGYAALFVVVTLCTSVALLVS